jgi:hypothetical protein
MTKSQPESEVTHLGDSLTESAISRRLIHRISSESCARIGRKWLIRLTLAKRRRQR